MTSLNELLFWLDSGVCSQHPNHSLWVLGLQLPLCARELGLFTAFLVMAPLARFVPARGKMIWLLGLLPFVADGVNSFASDSLGLALYAPTNLLRLATGALAGFSLAMSLAQRLSPASPFIVAVLLLLTALLPAHLYLGFALAGTAGVFALLAAANFLARPALSATLSWALTLPELAALAVTKQGLMTLLR